MGRQIGIFGGVGSVAGLIAVVVSAWRTSRPYAMGYVSGFAPLTQPWIPVVVLLAGCTIAGAGCGAVLWLSGWRMVRDDAGEDERRRRRTFLLGRTVAAGLAGVTVGLSPTLVLLYVWFTAAVGIAVEMSLVLALYAGSAVSAYGCALLAVWWVLTAAGDERRTATVRSLALVLPVGALAATAAGVAVAAAFGYYTDPVAFVCVILAVVMVLVATVGAARVSVSP
ncbi:hypothetical protein ACFTWF_39050 [Rhodococcus sp. NPDC056960]|uniref:hypothetical protein n=1 Tax=Rhodococcus sp. NPDC056960 TaxID=3345982 RepID=UPI00362871DB